MSYTFEGFAQQGWQCPVCGAVYSPTTPMCYNCTGKYKTYTFSTKTTDDSIIDWLHHDTVTKAEQPKESSDKK